MQVDVIDLLRIILAIVMAITMIMMIPALILAFLDSIDELKKRLKK